MGQEMSPVGDQQPKTQLEIQSCSQLNILKTKFMFFQGKIDF